MRTFLITAFVCLSACSAQFQNPSWIPAWQGKDPIRYCIAPEAEKFRPEIVNAFWTWKLTFRSVPAYETRDCEGPRTIAYRLVPLWGWIGTAMYPYPLFPEPHAGDVWISNFVDWNRNRTLLAAVLIHETGHAFGLGESRDPQDVMYPFVNARRLWPSFSERRRMVCLYDWICR